MKNEETRSEAQLPEETKIPAEHDLPQTEPAADQEWNESWDLDVDALIQDFLEVAQEGDGLTLPLFDETEEALVEPNRAPDAAEAPVTAVPSMDVPSPTMGTAPELPTAEELIQGEIDLPEGLLEGVLESAPALEMPENAPVLAEASEAESVSLPEATKDTAQPSEEELMTQFIPASELIDEPEQKQIKLQKPIRQVTRRNKRVRKRNFFGYFIAEGVRGIFSHGFMSFAAASIIAVCLLILGSFSLIALNLTENLESVMDKNQFLAYINETFSEEEARALQPVIEAIDNVSEVTFISREEAKQDYIEDQQDSDLYNDLPDSIFRHRFAIHVEDLEKLDETIEQVRGVYGIDKISANQNLAEKFVMVRNVLLIVAAVLVASLLLVSLFIIFNTIKLATISRQEEIAIMKMCGATNGFVRWPFIYEGAITGLVGSGVAYGLQYAIYLAVENTQMLQLEGLVRIVPWDTVYLYVLAGFLGIGLVIGVLGSVMGIRKFLKV